MSRPCETGGPSMSLPDTRHESDIFLFLIWCVTCESECGIASDVFQCRCVHRATSIEARSGEAAERVTRGSLLMWGSG